MTTTQPTPTPGAAWRAQRATTTVTTLAYSGLTVEIGHVQLDALLLAGKIPDLLTPIVAGVLWSSVGQGKAEDEIRADKDFYALVNSVVTAALVSPRVVANPTADDEIAITDLDFGDKIIVYTIALQPQGVLHRFRSEQGADVDTIPEGEDLQPAAE